MDVALPNQCEVGIVGLDLPGRQLARTLAEQGFRVAVLDRDAENIRALEIPPPTIHVASSPTEFMGALRRSRTVVVAADVFEDLWQLPETGDLIIDAGNYFFKDCARRAHSLAERGVRYLETGVISGGKDGCRGPVLMVGGRNGTYQSAVTVLEAMAGPGEPGAGRLGRTAAGHFVKMIHDSIEYTLARLFGETSRLLKLALALDDGALRETVRAWPMGEPHGGLRDDAARWTSQVARELGVAIPTLDAAAGLRVLSEVEKRNGFATALFRQPAGRCSDDAPGIRNELRGALQAAIFITYAEGMAVLAAGSQQYGFEIDSVEVLRLWKVCRGRRAALLDELALAVQAAPDNLLGDAGVSEQVMAEQERLRHAVWRAGRLQMPAPALAASLDSLDSCRAAWLPVNLIEMPRFTPTPLAALAPR